MINKNAQAWIEALRSGNYKQCDGALKKGDSYCCLGVACDLYIAEHEEAKWLLAGAKVSSLPASGQVLPHEVRDWMGLRYCDGGFVESRTSMNVRLTSTLAVTNDRGATFTEIADLIESEPESLFTAS